MKLLPAVEAGQAEGKSIEQMCRELNISDTSYFRWKSQYASSTLDEVRHLKELERLKRIVAELTFDKQILKEAARGN